MFALLSSVLPYVVNLWWHPLQVLFPLLCADKEIRDASTEADKELSQFAVELKYVLCNPFILYL